MREFHGTLDVSAFLPVKRALTTPSLEFVQGRVGDFRIIVVWDLWYKEKENSVAVKKLNQKFDC